MSKATPKLVKGIGPRDDVKVTFVEPLMEVIAKIH